MSVGTKQPEPRTSDSRGDSDAGRAQRHRTLYIGSYGGPRRVDVSYERVIPVKKIGVPRQIPAAIPMLDARGVDRWLERELHPATGPCRITMWTVPATGLRELPAIQHAVERIWHI